MSDIKEFQVDSRDFFGKAINKAKDFLKDNKKIKFIAHTHSANLATRIAETLRRDGYIEFDDVKTETKIDNNTRQVRLVITMHITENFDKLYKESEEERKKRQAEREERRKQHEEKKEETKKPKEK